MRVTAEADGLVVRAFAGTHVVLLGMDMPRRQTRGLLGFAIHRTDVTEDEAYWLPGFKTFEATDPGVPGLMVTTDQHPIQDFQWGDYTAKPEHHYRYRVVAVHGKPKRLEHRAAVEIEVRTEGEAGAEHGIWFNRGVAGSQAYARKFKNKAPDEVADREAFRWLSRGCEEALLGFIGRAAGRRFGLRAAVYEFSYAPVLEAFGAAARAGADVRIVYDGREKVDRDGRPRGPFRSNERAIRKAGIGELCTPRRAGKSYIAHNKFIVLTEDDRPRAVLTGSTNITEGGIFGHSNVVHIVEDAAVAAQFLAYWEELAKDPETEDLRDWTEEAGSVPGDAPDEGCLPLFSPRNSLAALEWYAGRFGAAEAAVFMTAAFGINKLIDAELAKDTDCLRYLLLEKEDGEVVEQRRDPDHRFSVGAHLEDPLERWAEEELTGFNTHVRYIHTKYMLVDPLAEAPLVITGSANFSDASIRNNDENMLVIQGDTRVADIYLGEFMRLFNHFYFRQFMRERAAPPRADRSTSRHLSADDSWTERYFEGFRAKQRMLFAGVQD